MQKVDSRDGLVRQFGIMHRVQHLTHNQELLTLVRLTHCTQTHYKASKASNTFTTDIMTPHTLYSMH